VSLPKRSKVNVKSPQTLAGLPTNFSDAPDYGGMNTSGNIKGGLKKNPAPGKASKPDQKGNKIKTIIQTSTPASKRGGK
jgi:hypothetical protein